MWATQIRPWIDEAKNPTPPKAGGVGHTQFCNQIRY